MKKFSNQLRDLLPLRIIKTSLSVFFAASFAGLIGFESTFFAGLGAVKSMGFSVRESFDTMKNQIIANAAAAVVGIAIAFTLGITPLAAGIGIFILLSALNYFKLTGTYVMAGITLCSILLASDSTATVLTRAADRFTLMSIGLIVSFLVNLLIFRPNYQIKVDEYIRGLVLKTNDFFALAQTGTLDQSLLQAIQVEYKLLQRYVGAAKSDENIAERFRYDHVKQLSALQLYLVETDIKIKLLTRLTQLEGIETTVYRDLQRLFAIEQVVTKDLLNEKIEMHANAHSEAQFHEAYAQLFAYFGPQIAYELPQAGEAIRILDLIAMYKTKMEQLFVLIAQQKGEN